MPLEGNENEHYSTGAGNQISENQGDSASTNLPPGGAPPQPPQSPPSNDQPPENPSKWRENAKLSLEVFGLVVLVAYTVFSCMQWLQIRWTNRLTREALNGNGQALQATLGKMQAQINAMNTLATNAGTQATQTTNLAGDTKDLVRTSRDALVSVQRAFIFATDLEGMRVADPHDATKIAYLGFSVTWVNNGTTPTRDMTEYSSWMTPTKPLPDNYSYPDLGNIVPSHLALGPKTVAHTTPIEIPADTIARIVNHQQYLYIWGWARYRDIFPKTKFHITRYCTELIGFDGDPLSAAGLAKPILVNCGNNCYDEECKIK